MLAAVRAMTVAGGDGPNKAIVFPEALSPTARTHALKPSSSHLLASLITGKDL